MAEYIGNFSASQFFSYYPKYEYLDSVLSATGRKKLKLYVDVKGCAKALFQEWAVKLVLDNTKNSNTVDTTLFASVLEFISWHKEYARKRSIDLQMYFFMESGKSSYHSGVYKDYKSNRVSSDFFDLDLESRELFHKILDKNYHVLDKVVNKLPGVSFIRLTYLEADFVPFFLMESLLPKEEVEDSANIIYSADKDMLQCLNAPNKYQFFKHSSASKMLCYKDIYEHWLKKPMEVNDPAAWFPLALAIIGDAGDGFLGVKGIGAANLIKVFEYVMTLCGRSMDSVYDNVRHKRPIFNTSYAVKNNYLQKIIEHQDVIIRNLKLGSFKILSDTVNEGYPTDMIDKKNQMMESLNNTYKCSGAGVMITALENAGLMGVVKESVVSKIF